MKVICNSEELSMWIKFNYLLEEKQKRKLLGGVRKWVS